MELTKLRYHHLGIPTKEKHEKEIIIHPNSPSEGVRVAFIIDNGAPVEFLQMEKNANDEK